MSVTIAKLDLPREPRWLDLPLGVRVKVRPLDNALFSAASRLAGERNSLAPADWAAGAVQAVRDGVWVAELTAAVAELAVMEWEGVVDDDDVPWSVGPVIVRRLIKTDWIIAQEFHQQYVLAGQAVAYEGNGWPSSGHGGTGAAATIAPGATPDPAPAAPSGSTGP